MILKPETPENLYEQLKKDFHASEIKSIDTFKRLVAQGYYRIYFFYDNDEFVGYACLAGEFVQGGCVLLDYFATTQSKRSMGYGTKMLKNLKSYAYDFGFSLVAESERPIFAKSPCERKQMERRIAFYKRNGALPTLVSSTVTVDKYMVLLLFGSMSVEKAVSFLEELYVHFFREQAESLVTILAEPALEQEFSSIE